MSAGQYNDPSQVNSTDLIFPTAEDMVNFTVDFNPLVADIPLQVIEERIQKLDENSSKTCILCIEIECYTFHSCTCSIVSKTVILL